MSQKRTFLNHEGNTIERRTRLELIKTMLKTEKLIYKLNTTERSTSLEQISAMALTEEQSTTDCNNFIKEQL